MTMTTSKTPQQIRIRITDRSIENGVAGAVQMSEVITLTDLLGKYLGRMGFESAVTSGIIVQLLTDGKVRVDFSVLAERLELLDQSDCMTAPQAMALFSDYLASTRSKDSENKKGKTLRIVVQKPRH
jgi:hypothetical protein